ncbi:MAG: LysM peptidoglycan-binding domain-containing protein [Rickettsiales bacterium]|jgi:murein DD-endopeptidase MepM/ murein hydrolase activator NlpD|nr:LysM peptidoglycan-binding domain-containing protein [Rickettsiales bacterium]
MFDRKFIVIFGLILAVSCVQESVNIVYKEESGKNNTRKQSTLQPSYMKGTYVKTGDNKVVRDLAKEDIKEPDKTEEEDSDTVESQDVQQNRTVKTIKLRGGDSLLSISNKYNMKLSEISELNNIKPPYKVYVGQEIKVYSSNQNDEEEESIENTKHFKIVTVEKGDSLLKIAASNNSTLRELAEINKIKPPYNVYVGQTIKIPEDNKNSKPNDKDYYIVERGDNLYAIARKNGINFTDLISNNNLKKPYHIHVGQKLHLKANKNIEAKRENKKPKSAEKVTVVKSGVKDTPEIPPAPTVVTVDQDSGGVSAPFLWPVKGEIIKSFGKQPNGEYSDAINIRVERGTRVGAASDGEVVYAGNELKNYGNMIILKHNDGWLSIYGYCDTVDVKMKDKVKEGQAIATVGKTGNVNEPQLYFAIRKGRVAVDPLKYLSK